MAATGPYGIRPGHALITMVEPHPGHEYAYNRWYEDDHYYAGAMAMPWMFAGRRWVTTRDLLERLAARELPRRLAGSPAAMVTVFRPTPLPGDRMTYVKRVEGVDTRLTLLWFLERNPRDCRAGHFADLGGLAGDAGRVELVAPFVPTVPGADLYVDRLR